MLKLNHKIQYCYIWALSGINPILRQLIVINTILKHKPDWHVSCFYILAAVVKYGAPYSSNGIMESRKGLWREEK